MENSKEEVQAMNMELVAMISDLSRELGQLEACYEMLEDSHKGLEDAFSELVISSTN